MASAILAKRCFRAASGHYRQLCRRFDVWQPLSSASSFYLLLNSMQNSRNCLRFSSKTTSLTSDTENNLKTELNSSNEKSNILEVDSSHSTAEAEVETIPGPSAQLTSSLSTDEQKRLQVLWMEIEVFRQSGYEVPKKLSDQDWEELMTLSSNSQRRKFCRHLMIKEVRIESDKKKKEERRKLREEQQQATTSVRDATPSGHMEYGLHRNTFFFKIHNSAMNQAYNHWACQSILFGQSLVFDMDYDQYMRKMDCQNCAEQIQMAYGFNKMSRHQFYLHLCNAQKDSLTMSCMEYCIPNMYDHNCMMNVTSQSYLDLFPKERIVYLTPHCNESLEKFDHNAVYVIGGLVDKAVKKPVTMAKAKREGVRMAKLPLDKYLLWGASTKSLALDQMLKIMLDVKKTGDWNTAFQHVPHRKLQKLDELPTSVSSSVRKARRERSLFDSEGAWLNR